MKKILILDTSILCVWLDVPGMATCGPDNDKWDTPRVKEKINAEIAARATLVLPLATLIETGNHIAQAKHSRRERADALGELMRLSADEQTPWAAFSDQHILWTPEKLKELADNWPALAQGQQLSLGDATIKDVAEFYAQMRCEIEILTGDQGLKAYEPAAPVEIPRRRQRL